MFKFEKNKLIAITLVISLICFVIGFFAISCKVESILFGIATGTLSGLVLYVITNLRAEEERELNDCYDALRKLSFESMKIKDICTMFIIKTGPKYFQKESYQSVFEESRKSLIDHIEEFDDMVLDKDDLAAVTKMGVSLDGLRTLIEDYQKVLNESKSQLNSVKAIHLDDKQAHIDSYAQILIADGELRGEKSISDKINEYADSIGLILKKFRSSML